MTSFAPTPIVTGPTGLEFPEGTEALKLLESYTATDPDREGIELAVTGADSEDFTFTVGASISAPSPTSKNPPTPTGTTDTN